MPKDQEKGIARSVYARNVCTICFYHLTLPSLDYTEGNAKGRPDEYRGEEERGGGVRPEC